VTCVTRYPALPGVTRRDLASPDDRQNAIFHLTEKNVRVFEPTANGSMNCRSAVIDVQPAFQAQDDPLSLFPFRKFGHYDERGNRVVASTLIRSLTAP